MGGGGGTTVQQAAVPAPSDNELALQSKQLDLAQAQLDAIKEQSAFQRDTFAAAKPMLDAQNKLAAQSLALLGDPNDPAVKARLDRQQQIGDLIDQQTLESLQRGGGPTDAQQKLIDQSADAAIKAGSIDIDRSRDESLRVLEQELAPQMGLRPSDSPVQTRAAQVLAEYERQKGALTTGVRLAASNAALGAQGAQAGVFQAIGDSRTAVNQSQSTFMADLRDVAATNRLRLAGSYGGFSQAAGNLGLGLVSGIPFNVNQAAGTMQQGRLAATQTTSTNSQQFNPSSLIGPGVSAAAAIGGAMFI